MKHTTSSCLLAALLFSVVGCQSDPYTGEKKASNTARNAVIGAVGGAAVGAIIGNNTGDGDARKGALIGAGVGAGVGGGVGLYMDKKEAAIRDQLRGSGVSVTRQENNIILNMPHDITFDVAKDQLRPQFTGTLDSVAVVFQKFDQTLVNINGHTDSDGSDSYNLSLSQRRARSVANYLTGRGVVGGRLNVQGFGEAYPVAANTSDSGKARNRRVEIHIVPREDGVYQ